MSPRRVLFSFEANDDEAKTDVMDAPVCVCARARLNPLLNTEPLPLELDALAAEVLLMLSRWETGEIGFVDVVGVEGGDWVRNAEGMNVWIERRSFIEPISSLSSPAPKPTSLELRVVVSSVAVDGRRLPFVDPVFGLIVYAERVLCKVGLVLDDDD